MIAQNINRVQALNWEGHHVTLSGHNEPSPSEKGMHMPINTEELLRILACPKCLGSLTALEENAAVAGFACAACQVVYPVREDIPVMLVEEAEDRPTWNARHPEARERS